MPRSDLTHVWLEAPLFDAALRALPQHVKRLFVTGDPFVSLEQALPAQAIVASSRMHYTAQVLAALPNLRVIVRTGIGVDNAAYALFQRPATTRYRQPAGVWVTRWQGDKVTG